MNSVHQQKIEEAQEILNSLELPQPQQNKLSALTLLALCNVKPEDEWENATRKSMTLSKDIMNFANQYYKAGYAVNSRESFRKNALKPFVENDIVEQNPDNPNLNVNSSNTHYAISYIALNTIKKYKTDEWDIALENYKKYKHNTDSKIDVRLNRIIIKNYKSIINDTIELGKLNVFIGANGSGKTNILESLAFIGAYRNNDLNYDGLNSRGVRIARPDLTLSSFSDFQQSGSVDVALTYEENSQTFNLDVSLFPAKNNDIYTKWMDVGNEDNYGEVLLSYFDQLTKEKPGISGKELVKGANEMISARGLIEKTYFDKVLSEYSIYDLNTKSLRGITPAESKKTPLGLNGEGLDLLIASFNKAEREYLNKCRYLFDWLKEIITDKDDKLKLGGLKPGRSISTLYFKDQYMLEHNNTFSAENSNEGVLHVLFYLSLFKSRKTPMLFAIDNIETALNPRLCEALIMELGVLTKEMDKQVLITTHNPAILDGMNLFDEDQRLFEVYRNSNGQTKTRRIKFKSDLSNKQHKLSEMWLKGLIGAVPDNF